MTLLVYVASAYAGLQRSNAAGSRALSEIKCLDSTCDITQFMQDYRSESPDYIVDTLRRYVIVAPIATLENPGRFAPLDYSDTAFVKSFRTPVSWTTPDGGVWRVYSREAEVAGKKREIVVGYEVFAPWNLSSVPDSEIGKVDDRLRLEANKIASGPVIEKTGLRARSLSASGFQVIDSKTNHVLEQGPWVPTILPTDTRLPSPGWRLYLSDTVLYVVQTNEDTNGGRLLATSLVEIADIWWLVASCGLVFLGTTLIARTLSQRFLRGYFAMTEARVPTLEEALRGGEGQAVEFKRGLSDDEVQANSVEDELLKSIAAFANTNDGIIFIGVDDGGRVKGLGLDFTQKDRLERKIRQLVRNRIRPTPPFQIAFEDVRGLVVAKVTIARGDAPVYMIGGVVYLRYGSSDVQAQPEDLRRLVLDYAL